jgi:hypothetical protein
MDPATAIGVASSCIAFYEFTVKLGRTVRSIRDACGQLPSDLQICHRLIESFERVLIRLHRHVQLSVPFGPLTESDSDLVMLIKDCLSTGQKLLHIFEGFDRKSSPQTRPSWPRDFQKALRIIREEGHITEIQQKLEQCRAELILLVTERAMMASSQIASVEVELSPNNELINISLALDQGMNQTHILLENAQQEHSLVIDQLSRHNLLFDDFGNSFTELMRDSTQTAFLLQKILEKADSGRLDPNLIYIAVPRLHLNLLQYWNLVSYLAVSNNSVTLTQSSV